MVGSCWFVVRYEINRVRWTLPPSRRDLGSCRVPRQRGLRRHRAADPWFSSEID